ncbi:hypothetical protein Val02_53030 [Virgisporangium aliadipatigenens]|uniref:Uncharacterized protein n=1 Tax=Virgisporangium aliadipatigenens TaxID=741659 RepID=A0A8J4DTP5_9ACTN|nr:hypothetical protein [Virgisporangium aliadipatigenens]GIJ48417.1 hypothetical protein Val02_53030 [Virgisporangium aliadipatigenens]
MYIHRTLAVVLVAALAGALPALLGRAAAPVPADPSVTLVTGDRIVLGERVSVRPGAGRAGMSFATWVERGHLVVVPADALGLVAGGRVDRRLFDVTALREAGFDDARPAALSELTVEVSYDDGAHWLPAPVVACGTAWTARPPAGTGPMSVRARATDSLGATVEETIIRAHGDR